MSYKVMQGDTEIGVSPTIVHIYMGENGAYQECSPDEAQGFCVKLPNDVPAVLDEDGRIVEETGVVLFDTVFSLPGLDLTGAVGEATFKEI